MNNGPRVEIKMAKVELIGAFNDVQQRDFSLKQKCMFLTKNNFHQIEAVIKSKLASYFRS